MSGRRKRSETVRRSYSRPMRDVSGVGKGDVGRECISCMIGVLLVSLGSSFPDTSSPDPSLAMVGNGGRASRMPGKFYTPAFRWDLSHRQTGRTLKAGNAGFSDVSKRDRNFFGKRTPNGFTDFGSGCFPNRITFWGTLTHTRLSGLRRHLWHGECRRGGLRDLGCLESLRRSTRRFRLPVCRFCRLFHQRLKLFGTFAIVERHFVFACARFHLQT